MSDKPIRIFVGTEPKTRVAFRVLSHSIQARTKRAVSITPMIGEAWEYPTEGIKVGTGFSLRRWMIPAACGWEGHAIYLDADQLVLGDVEELYDLGRARLPAEPDAPVIACTRQKDKFNKLVAAPQTSVMVIDCWRAFKHWQFDIKTVLKFLQKKSDRASYVGLMHAAGLPVAADPLPAEWNHLNEYKKGKTKLLHYTKEDAQPWYKPDHSLAGLWHKALDDAIAAGFVTRDELESALGNWKKKEDWRKSNGMHPYYRKFLERFPA